MVFIVESPTGVIYGNQCGGYVNQENKVEGFAIPLGERELEEELYSFFETEFGGHGYHPEIQWTESRIEKLAEIIGKIPCWECSQDDQDMKHLLQLDRTRMDQCIEAWIPCTAGSYRGYLALKNSD